MNKREEMQRTIDELEAKDAPTPDEKAELKQKRQELKRIETENQRITLCSHEGARLEHRFCPSCGESMPSLPRTAIEEIIEEVVTRRGLNNDQQTDEEEDESKLRTQFQAYEQELSKRRFFERQMAKFCSFEHFSKATPVERRAEFQRLGIAEPWRSKSAEQRKGTVNGKAKKVAG